MKIKYHGKLPRTFNLPAPDVQISERTSSVTTDKDGIIEVDDKSGEYLCGLADGAVFTKVDEAPAPAAAQPGKKVA